MKGLKENTQEVFELLSRQVWLKSYTLIGGTALALQIHHRISEYLDFCIWQNPSTKGRLLISQEEIARHFSAMGLHFEITRLLDNQIDLIANEVKITFFADSENRAPQGIFSFYENIRIPNVINLAAMKACVMFDRSKFRDYYDLYCIGQMGFSIQQMIDASLQFKPYLNPKLITIMLTDGNRIKDEPIEHLNPLYKVTKAEIENYFKGKVKEWVSTQ
jgi:predicted nucleotidyltransferase component of viral defense system